MSKKIVNLFISFLMILNVILPCEVSAETVGFNVSVVWNDNNNAFGFRPDNVDYQIVSGDETKMTGNAALSELWSDDISLSSDWGTVSVVFPKLEGYSSFGRLHGNSYVQTYNSLYSDVSDRLYIDTIWNDSGSSSRPETYTLTVNDRFGTEKTYSIAKAQTQFISDDFVFARDGVLNELTASASAAGYKTTVSADTSAVSGLHITVTHTYQGSDPLSAGLQTISYAGETLHVYKMSGKEKLALLSSTDGGGPGSAINIANFSLPGKTIKAIVNASYFNNTSDTSVYGQIYGRAQGFSMGSAGYIDARTGGPQDDWAAAELARYNGNKPYMDLVIDKNNNIHAGDYNSWDYPLSDITLGVAPAVIEILNGTTHEYYSPAVGTGKMTTKNTETGLAKTADGSWALFTVENGNGGLSPRVGIKNFGNAYGFTELSVYDSGGSTQMLVNGSRIQYTGRKIPDVLIVYEDSSVNYKTVTIKFRDGTNFLDNYTIVKTFEEGKTAETNIDETVNLLYNAGYDMETSAWMDQRIVDGSVSEIILPVTHRKEPVVEQTEKQFTRTIKFLDPSGIPLKPAVIQSLTSVTLGSGIKDLVTGEITYDESVNEYWNEGSVFPEVIPETIPGYETPGNVPEEDIAWLPESERTSIVTVTYTQAEPKTYKILFQDTDADPQNLDLYTTVYEVNEGETVSVDISGIVTALRNKGYLIKEQYIPTVIGTSDITIPVEHTVTKKEDEPEQTVYVRKVLFLNENDEELSPEIVQSITRTKVREYYEDKVTGNVKDESERITWESEAFDAVLVPEIEGYHSSITNIDPLEVYDDMEVETVVKVYFTQEQEIVLHVNTSEPVEVIAGAVSDSYFAGWSKEPYGVVDYPAYQRFVIGESQDLYAVFTDEEEIRPLDVNARVNGRYTGSTNGIAVFDVAVNGEIVKESAVDFYKKYPVGTEFEILNIVPSEGYIFTGVSTAKSYSGCVPVGSLRGRIASGGVSDLVLSFITEDYTGTAGNVAKTAFRPVISSDLYQSETYTVSAKPEGDSVFAGWDPGNDAEWASLQYLDVNAKVNGKYRGNISDIGTFDVFINGEMAARNVTDHYRKWPENASYNIVLHKTDDSLDFIGVSETASRGYIPGMSLDGYVSYGKTEVMLLFEGSLPKLTLVSGRDDEEVVMRGETAVLNDPFNYSDALLIGWSDSPTGEILYTEGEEIAVSEDMTLYAIYREASYLDVNGVVDGVYVGSLKDVTEFDVEIAGEVVSEGVYDFWRKVPVGSGVFIRNIRPKDGYRLVKVTTKNVIDITFGKYPQAFVIGPGVRNEVYLRFETGGDAELSGDAYEGVEEEVFWDGDELVFREAADEVVEGEIEDELSENDDSEVDLEEGEG